MEFDHTSIAPLCLHSALTTFHACLYLSGRGSKSGSRNSSRLQRKLEPEPVMELEKNAFYVVRKGDVVGVYTSLSDCQAQVCFHFLLVADTDRTYRYQGQ